MDSVVPKTLQLPAKVSWRHEAELPSVKKNLPNAPRRICARLELLIRRLLTFFLKTFVFGLTKRGAAKGKVG
jgi:hypothetical protein